MHAKIPRSGTATAGFSRDWAVALRELSQKWAEYDHECIAYLDAGGNVRALPNVSNNRTHQWRVMPGQWAEALDNAALIVHSHPGGNQFPSVTDQRAQIATGIPHAICPRDGEPFVWGPGVSDPLIGRPYRWGVSDCYSIWRDYYRTQTGAEFPNFPRAWKFWQRQEPIFERGIEGIPHDTVDGINQAQAGDGLLFRLRSKVWNHCAVYLGNGQMLHHAAGPNPYDPSRPSRRQSVERFLTMPHEIVRFA